MDRLLDEMLDRIRHIFEVDDAVEEVEDRCNTGTVAEKCIRVFMTRGRVLHIRVLNVVNGRIRDHEAMWSGVAGLKLKRGLQALFKNTLLEIKQCLGADGAVESVWDSCNSRTAYDEQCLGVRLKNGRDFHIAVINEWPSERLERDHTMLWPLAIDDESKKLFERGCQQCGSELMLEYTPSGPIGVCWKCWAYAW